MNRLDIIKHCDSIIHTNTLALSKPRLYEQLIDAYWIKRKKGYGTILIVTSDIDNTYDNIHKAIVSYMSIDIMCIRRDTTEITIDCLIGQQEKILIVIKRDRSVKNIRGMRVDLVILDAVDDVMDIKEEEEVLGLLTLTCENKTSDMDRLILIY